MRNAGTTSAARFLDPVVLARISNLELVARSVVEGFITGLHHAPYLGLSMDFAEHRAYMPGDDIRRIDWRLFARTDRFFVKQFEADTNTNFTVVLDQSKSMNYGTTGITKLDYAKILAACLCYFCSHQRDRVGMITFDEKIREHVPPSAKHLEVILHTLDRLKPGGQGGLTEPLRLASEHFRRRSIVCVISDFYDEPQNVIDAIRPLMGRGNDVLAFHILDPGEIDFPYDAPMNFADSESGETMPVVPEQLKAQYRELVLEHIATLDRLMTENRIDYAQFTTSQPLDFPLFSFLSRRERLSRVR